MFMYIYIERKRICVLIKSCPTVPLWVWVYMYTHTNTHTNVQALIFNV